MLINDRIETKRVAGLFETTAVFLHHEENRVRAVEECHTIIYHANIHGDRLSHNMEIEKTSKKYIKDTLICQ